MTVYKYVNPFDAGGVVSGQTQRTLKQAALLVIYRKKRQEYKMLMATPPALLPEIKISNARQAQADAYVACVRAGVF